MQVDIDIEKIKELLEKAIKAREETLFNTKYTVEAGFDKMYIFVDQAFSLLPKPCQAPAGKIEEIRGLLEGAVRDTKAYSVCVFWQNPNFLIVSKYDFDQALSLLPKPCEQCGGSGLVPDEAEIIDGLVVAQGGKPCPTCQALSLLPKPCSTCGGSGKKVLSPKPTITELEKLMETSIGFEIMPNGDVQVPCPDCQAPACKPCKTCGGMLVVGRRETTPNISDSLGGMELIPCPDCQAPAGEVEELLKEIKIHLNSVGHPIYKSLLGRAYIHLEAQAKQIQEAKEGNAILKAKIEHLETEKKRLKELLASLYSQVSTDSGGEWVIDDRVLEKEIKQALQKGE